MPARAVETFLPSGKDPNTCENHENIFFRLKGEINVGGFLDLIISTMVSVFT